MPIKVLDPKVVSQIAAGEVVERPASVVKELVENSLDAAATQISVEVRGGGTALIRVIDDGVGIPSDEVELAFRRHATSKVSVLEDLERIESLGFRGEALPSIAVVAEVEMATCARGEAGGTYIKLEDGEVVDKQGRGRSHGTTVTVRNLFRKVPARLKFLKSPATENSHIANVVSQYAFSYPEVRFILLIDGKVALRTPGSGRLLDSVIEVYGLDIAQGMLEVNSDDKGWEGERAGSSMKVTGMAGSPSLSRSSRNFLSFFVNRRWVSSRLLSWAAEEAYHGLLMTGKHPIAIINLALPPEDVDVNIHPAKSEVKFRDEKAVFGAVQKAVRQSLIRSTPVPHMEDTAVQYESPPAQQKEIPWLPFEERKSSAPATVASQIPFTSLPVLRVLGQLESSYIVAEGPDGLYLIDQHAAHERIRFEEFRRQRSGKGVEVQGLLTPATFEVSPRQDAVLKSHFSELANFGFSLEPFGERTYLVRTVPAVLHDADWMAVLREVLDGDIGGDWSERVAISLACHSAVRAGQVLSDREMRELVDKLAETTLPHTCPHGRPTTIKISSERLKKDFGRT